MSRYNREKHIKNIELLQDASYAISRLLDEGRGQEVLQLLAECQDAAIALGSHIEKLYGLGTQTVGALEQYCEALYQLSVAMCSDEERAGQHGGEDAIQANQPFAHAMRDLSQATEQIRITYDAEFPEKKEVVFLPYNASMWDSLESVWMAARDDENCDAYVVPIPYYDLDAKRNFIEKHYEGDLYPDYVPITHYADYDLEEHHPDIIFIHNPYDEGNHITSIAPEFYSSRIKDFTDKLVYIPYFVLGEIKPDNQTAIDSMKHFCYLPGTIYADKVIVQSEDMRQIYINEYLKAAILTGESVTRAELEERILGLGSPKFDKAVNTKKENLEIPAEWLEIIEKPDGSWKKIIFYNTSIGAFLKGNEQMLEKIKDVLRIFKENQDEVALLWRPHPLMMQTLESMRLDLKESYVKIVQQYRAEGWGIYDDTPDMDRAIAISDAYYGDPSSVVQLYQETGKPVMVQNVECITK